MSPAEKRRAKQREYNQRPEVKERRRLYSQRPEVRAKKWAYNQRPEVKAKKNEAAKKVYAERRLIWEAFMEGRNCIACGEDHPAVLDWHHVDPKTKVAGVSELHFNGKPWEMVEEEYKKCILLCSNCHRIVHHEERLWHQNQK